MGNLSSRTIKLVSYFKAKLIKSKVLLHQFSNLIRIICAFLVKFWIKNEQISFIANY